MKITCTQVITELRTRLPVSVGRHLYGVLGTYVGLEQFEQDHLAQAKDLQGKPFPPPTNLNREVLARIGDEDLKRLVRDEARRPRSVQRRLGQELDRLLGARLQDSRFLIAKQLELVLAYGLDFSVFRTRAANQNHILLLLPGERRGGHIALFHEAEQRFHRSIPTNLIADNHLWELRDG